jgi:hypothetical protein
MSGIMKMKLTPLLVLSIGLILLGLVYIFGRSTSNLGPLVGMAIVFAGVLCLLPYFLLRILFPVKVKNQVFTELFLILLISSIYYKFNEKILLHTPKDFKGDIVLIYDVTRAPALETKWFFNNNIDVTVPASGILLTSTTTTGYTGGLVVVDSTRNTIKLYPEGYGVAFIADTLVYKNKLYHINVLNKQSLINWKLRADSAKRVFRKVLAKA